MNAWDWTLRVDVPLGDISRLQELGYFPRDTDEAVLIVTKHSARLEYYYYGRNKNGERNVRRTFGSHVFDERGAVQPAARIREILGDRADPFLEFGTQQLWPR
jgi:hypothetical protein